VGTVEDGDAVVLFNFRADRMVEMSKALEYETFTAFDRVRFPKVSRSRAKPFARSHDLRTCGPSARVRPRAACLGSSNSPAG
jgi:bisphosphoglycerate-independent phosphoglycerate mutase (AlkP superfamily)